MSRKNIKAFMEFATQRSQGALDVDEFVERFPDDQEEQQVLLAMLSVEIGMTARRNTQHIRRLWVVSILALALGLFSAVTIIGIDIGPAVVTGIIGGAVTLVLRFV